MGLELNNGMLEYTPDNWTDRYVLDDQTGKIYKVTIDNGVIDYTEVTDEPEMNPTFTDLTLGTAGIFEISGGMLCTWLENDGLGGSDSNSGGGGGCCLEIKELTEAIKAMSGCNNNIVI